MASSTSVEQENPGIPSANFTSSPCLLRSEHLKFHRRSITLLTMLNTARVSFREVYKAGGTDSETRKGDVYAVRNQSVFTY